MLFAVILTPPPVGELLFITKKRSGFRVLIVKSIISAPLSTKRSWRAASEEFDSASKNTVVCDYFNSSPRLGAPLYYKKEEHILFCFYCKER